MPERIVPLDLAHEVLQAFGIDGSSKGYQRWRRDEGIALRDLASILAESKSVLIVDWRESLNKTSWESERPEPRIAAERPLSAYSGTPVQRWTYLEDAMSAITDQLAGIGIAADADLGEGGEQGTTEINGRSATIKYVPSDGDDFDAVIRAINGLIAPQACYRRLRSSEGSDGYSYGLLSSEDWASLWSTASELCDELFLPADG
jgi:hypothetical protein